MKTANNLLRIDQVDLKLANGVICLPGIALVPGVKIHETMTPILGVGWRGIFDREDAPHPSSCSSAPMKEVWIVLDRFRMIGRDFTGIIGGRNLDMHAGPAVC